MLSYGGLLQWKGMLVGASAVVVNVARHEERHFDTKPMDPIPFFRRSVSSSACSMEPPVTWSHHLNVELNVAPSWKCP